MAIVLIGIDDTDNDTSPGTGQLARRLTAELSARGAASLGITRHQFLLDDRVPFTSHNSGACVAVEWAGAPEELSWAMDLIQTWSAQGSDPGVCICPARAVPRAVMEFGYRATREVLTMDEARAVAQSAGLHLRALGGTGQGIIGALGSVGLRAEGNNGRFLDLPGLRELPDPVRAIDMEKLGIKVEHRFTAGALLPDAAAPRENANGALYRTFGWIRPRLIRGKAVWPVEWSEEHNEWLPIDRKRSRPLE
ncbi:MAG TPA: hypothetical protein VFC78_19145 [Tepidisphaeraceae bacterium]|nr:hypothetical protein [Tepidisphaeraceae bacterium]